MKIHPLLEKNVRQLKKDRKKLADKHEKTWPKTSDDVIATIYSRLSKGEYDEVGDGKDVANLVDDVEYLIRLFKEKK